MSPLTSYLRLSNVLPWWRAEILPSPDTVSRGEIAVPMSCLECRRHRAARSRHKPLTGPCGDIPARMFKRVGVLTYQM